MSNDDKTLADVQPGGRVRLGDSLPPLPRMHRFTNLYGETYAYSAEQMWDYAHAALSAQPSPGGQGLDPGRVAVEFIAAANFDVPDGYVVEEHLPGIWHYTYTDAGEKMASCASWNNKAHATIAAWQAALAARQPVGQERVAWASTGATGHKVVAMPGLHKLPYGDYDLYAAPPAQAVDLERFRPAVMTALGLSSPYGLERETLNELLDLIDSQAVGK